MGRRVITVLIVLLLGASLFAGGGREETSPTPIPQREGFSRAQAAGVDVQWRVEGENITVQMTAPTTGWVAVGFDPSRMMADANMIIGYVSNGELMIADDYGTGNTSHGRDTANGGSDDIIDAEGSEENGQTQITFTIPLDSGDATDRPLAEGNSYKVIVAYGPKGEDNFDAYHAARGVLQMEL